MYEIQAQPFAPQPNMLDALFKGQSQRVDIQNAERDQKVFGEERQHALQKRKFQLLAREVKALDNEEAWNRIGPEIAQKYQIEFKPWEGGVHRQRILDMGAETDPQLLDIRATAAEKNNSLFGNSFEGKAREIIAMENQNPGTYPQEVIQQAIAYLKRPRFAPQGGYPVVADVPGVPAPVQSSPLAPPGQPAPGTQRAGSATIGAPLEKQATAGQVSDISTLDSNISQLDNLEATFKPEYSGPDLLMNSELGQSIKKDYPAFSGLIERNTPIKMPSNESGTWWESYKIWANKARNDLFGSALTATEKAAFDAATPNPGMDPTRIKANFRLQKAASMRALAKIKAAMKAGNYDPNFGAKSEGFAPTDGAPTPAQTAPQRFNYDPATDDIVPEQGGVGGPENRPPPPEPERPYVPFPEADMEPAPVNQTASVRAYENGMGIAPPTTLGEIGRRGPRALSIQMADIEHARDKLSNSVEMGGKNYASTIARLKEDWKREKARVMASPQYKWLKNNGLLYLLDR